MKSKDNFSGKSASGSDNLWFWIVICLYLLITIVRLVFHQPWYDEAHAWSIAKDLNLLEIIKLMCFEGHTFIWYLLLMPFAKTNFHYPWPMLIMNYVFALASVVLLWKKAPLHNITKTMITFSFPFLACLPILARCYSIGVLLLFALADMFKDRLKHPIIYSVLIILCANTSVMALFGAAAFGFMFAYDLIVSNIKKETSNKDFILSFVIMAVGAVLIFWQLGCTSMLITTDDGGFINNFSEFVFGHTVSLINWLNVVGIVAALFIIPVCLGKNLRAQFFYWFTVGGLFAVFLSVYSGFAHHYIFIYAYALLTLWVAGLSGKKFIITQTVLALMFLGQIFSHKNLDIMYFAAHSKDVSQAVLNDPALINSRIIIYDLFAKRFLPYFDVQNMDVWDYCSSSRADYDVTMNNNSPVCKIKYKTYIAKYVEKVMSEDKDNYSLISVLKGSTVEPAFLVQDKDIRILFEFYKAVPKTDYVIYKTVKVKK